MIQLAKKSIDRLLWIHAMNANSQAPTEDKHATQVTIIQRLWIGPVILAAIG